MTSITHDKAQVLSATRLRRTLYWMRKGPETPEMQRGIDVVVRLKYWRVWGFPRLLECLMQEFRMNEDQALERTRLAIINGDEDAKLYGVGNEVE